MEAVRIKLEGAPQGTHVRYRAHVKDRGWLPWVTDGAEAGAAGQRLRMEALEVEIVGNPHWTVVYQAHVKDMGWQQWAADGATAGTTGQGKRMEAMRMLIARRK
jgi:uncharacterized protein YjdB